jgi:ribosomal-protein-alanine N-acetyltransferase
VLEIDGRAFVDFWALDELGLRNALQATPTTRFRVAEHDGVPAAYAITGRAIDNGYLQRIAVDPSVQGTGLGAGLVADALGWLARHKVSRALVNTQLDNEAALKLYLRCGFERLPVGLCVLGRAL